MERIVTLHGPLDGLLKARYDMYAAELSITYAGQRCELDEDDCDKLLRLVEVSNDAVGDLTEFFRDAMGYKSGAYRIAHWYFENASRIAECVYV